MVYTNNRILVTGNTVIAPEVAQMDPAFATAGGDDNALLGPCAQGDANAEEVEANIYQVRNRSGQDPLNFPIKVNNRLANLLSMSERGDGRPGNNMPVIFDILVEELTGYQQQLDAIWQLELGEVNRILGDLGLPTIDPECDQAAGCMVM